MRWTMLPTANEIQPWFLWRAWKEVFFTGWPLVAVFLAVSRAAERCQCPWPAHLLKFYFRELSAQKWRVRLSALCRSWRPWIARLSVMSSTFEKWIKLAYTPFGCMDILPVMDSGCALERRKQNHGILGPLLCSFTWCLVKWFLYQTLPALRYLTEPVRNILNISSTHVWLRCKQGLMWRLSYSV